MDMQPVEPTFPIPRRGDPLHPPGEYARYRDQEAATRVKMWDGRYAWIFTRYDDVRELLSSPHFSAMPSKPGYPFLSPARAAAVKAYQTFITMDPPDHSKFRRMLTKDFTQKRIEGLRPGIQTLVDQLIDDMIKRGPPLDFVAHLAMKLPVTVVSMMVGVPYADTHLLEKWSIEKLNLTLAPEVTAKASTDMFNYFDELLKKKEADPGDGSDMLSRLVIEQIRPGHLSRLDCVHMVNLLYFAGHETTANQIALGTLSFLLDPVQRKELTDDPALVKPAVEEMLRFHTIAHYNACRVATADVVIGGHQIRAGEGCYALIASANRDPGHFPEPNKFDIHRKNAEEHVAFSYGIHHCIGQPLARLELEVVFSTLFKRLPGLKLAIPYEKIPFKRDMYVYGLHALPVSW
jgi:cytochrome P450